MDRTVTLSKHEMVVDRDDYEDMVEQIKVLKTKTISVYPFGKDSAVVDALIEYGQEEHMAPMEEVMDHLKEADPDEYQAFINEVDTDCAECLLMQAW